MAIVAQADIGIVLTQTRANHGLESVIYVTPRSRVSPATRGRGEWTLVEFSGRRKPGSGRARCAATTAEGTQEIHATWLGARADGSANCSSFMFCRSGKRRAYGHAVTVRDATNEFGSDTRFAESPRSGDGQRIAHLGRGHGDS
jgi:hypothetical protein